METFSQGILHTINELGTTFQRSSPEETIPIHLGINALKFKVRNSLAGLWEVATQVK
jgi:hypothetical protein